MVATNAAMVSARVACLATTRALLFYETEFQKIFHCNKKYNIECSAENVLLYISVQ